MYTRTHKNTCCHMVQGELAASSQAKVVELHRALTQHAHRAGITDQQLMVDNARMSSELESSTHFSNECQRCAPIVTSSPFVHVSKA